MQALDLAATVAGIGAVGIGVAEQAAGVPAPARRAPATVQADLQPADRLVVGAGVAVADLLALAERTRPWPAGVGAQAQLAQALVQRVGLGQGDAGKIRRVHGGIGRPDRAWPARCKLQTCVFGSSASGAHETPIPPIDETSR